MPKSKKITSTYLPLYHDVQGTSTVIKVKCLAGFAEDMLPVPQGVCGMDARRRLGALRERRNRETNGGLRLPELFRQRNSNPDGARREPRVTGAHLVGTEASLHLLGALSA